ncbi:hypothetical protein ABZ348_15465 [Streptomyces sp. NPDC005963]|uniref:hypothetical protein n=1 Tax=Streptomyces sp. NPDC005963 TaxID=3156721 RepID=UPI0033FBBAED
MRDLIACALAWVLSPFRAKRRPGRHSAGYLAHRMTSTVIPQQAPEDTSSSQAWARPWSGPSAALARSVFRAEEAEALTPECRERFFATAWAELGYDYSYVADGVHQVWPGAAA